MDPMDPMDTMDPMDPMDPMEGDIQFSFIYNLALIILFVSCYCYAI